MVETKVSVFLIKIKCLQKTANRIFVSSALKLKMCIVKCFLIGVAQKISSGKGQMSEIVA